MCQSLEDLSSVASPHFSGATSSALMFFRLLYLHISKSERKEHNSSLIADFTMILKCTNYIIGKIYCRKAPFKSFGGKKERRKLMHVNFARTRKQIQTKLQSG